MLMGITDMKGKDDQIHLLKSMIQDQQAKVLFLKNRIALFAPSHPQSKPVT